MRQTALVIKKRRQKKPARGQTKNVDKGEYAMAGRGVTKKLRCIRF